MALAELSVCNLNPMVLTMNNRPMNNRPLQMSAAMLAAVLLGAAVLGGCALGPDYKTPPMKLAADFENATGDQQEPPREFWRRYGRSMMPRPLPLCAGSISTSMQAGCARRLLSKSRNVKCAPIHAGNRHTIGPRSRCREIGDERSDPLVSHCRRIRQASPGLRPGCRDLRPRI